MDSRAEELLAQLRALPPWAPWDSAEACIASLRQMLRQERETSAGLREALSRARAEGAALARAADGKLRP